MSEQSSVEELASGADKQTLRIGEGKPGPGRPKGVPNKTTAILKDAIIQAARLAGGSDDDDGLVVYLTNQAQANPGPFLSLLGKVLPMTVAGDKDSPLTTITRIELVAPAHVQPTD